MVPISSRKIEPPSASAKRPFLFAVAPVKAPRTWPKSSDSSSVSGIAAQLTLMRGIARWALRSWMARATSSLPVPVSPVMSTVLFDWATRSIRCSTSWIARLRAHDAVVAELLVPFREQVAVLRAEALVLEGAAHDHEQFVDLEGLLEVVEGPEPHGLDRALDRGVGRHHHDLGPLAFGQRRGQFTEHLEAGLLRHAVVHDEHVEAPLRQQALRLGGARRRHHVVIRVAQRPAQGPDDLLLVVDEQDRAAGFHGYAVLGCRGSSRRTSVPSPRRLSTSSAPPSASTTLRAIASPKPVPVRLVVK